VLHLQEILNGGVDICRQAGIPLAGGHSIDSPEPIFGLVVTGVVDPNLVKRNSAAKVGCRHCSWCDKHLIITVGYKAA
jgi:selenide,water dikinase